MAAFKWEDNLVCKSVYLILEDDTLMDEMESQIFPFAESGAVKVSQLNFYILSSGTSADQRDFVRRSRAVKFTRSLIERCRPKWKAANSNADLVRDKLIMMFRNGETTLEEIAGYVDQQFILSQLPTGD